MEHLNERQRQFVDFYIQSGNAAQSARKAGYSAQSARQIAKRLLSRPAIHRAIDDRLKVLESQRTAKTQELLEHLTSVVRGEVLETITTNSGKVFEVPVQEKDRLKACELLLKVHGAFQPAEAKVDVNFFVDELTKIWAEE